MPPTPAPFFSRAIGIHFGLIALKNTKLSVKKKEEAHPKSDESLLTRKNTSLTVGNSTSGSNGASDLSDLVVSLLEYEPIPDLNMNQISNKDKVQESRI